MSSALSDRTIDLVKATVPALEGQGTAVTDRMYQLLFRSQEIRDLLTSRITAKRVLSRRP
jgi:nitric oxide dioxygenase